MSKFKNMIWVLLVTIIVSSCSRNDNIIKSEPKHFNIETKESETPKSKEPIILKIQDNKTDVSKLKVVEVKTNNPKKVISNFLELPQIKNAGVGIKVVNLDKEKVLYEKNSNRSLVPASNIKLITTGIALETLGADYRFKTTVTYDGVINKNGILDGNIYIIGGGDPTLGSKYLVSKNPDYVSGIERKKQLEFLDIWIKEIEKLGIKKINGKIIADSSYLPKTTLSTTWEWGDLRYYFASPPSGLTFMDNNIRLTLKKYGKGISASISPSYSETKITNKVVIDPKNKNKITIVVVPYSNEIIVLGTLNKAIASYTTIMQKPAPTLATLFSEKLELAGIENNGGIARDEKSEIEKYETNQGMKEIYINYSPRLEKIIEYTNKYSVNLFAEHLKLEVEKKTNRKIKDLWKEKIKIDGLYIYDGSGLSRYNGVTPNTIVEVLKYMKNSNEFESFYNSLAEPKKNGTFKTFEDGVLVDNLHGKSGTLTGVKAYSGYMHNEDGDLLAFSIIINHHGMSGITIGKKLEQVMDSFYYLK